MQTKFQVDAMRDFKVIKSKKSQNSALGQEEISLAHSLLDIKYCLSVTARFCCLDWLVYNHCFQDSERCCILISCSSSNFR